MLPGLGTIEKRLVNIWKLVFLKLHLNKEAKSIMEFFLGVAASAIDESLQKLVNWLVAHLSLQPTAFFPASKVGLIQLALFKVSNVATLLIFLSFPITSL